FGFLTKRFLRKPMVDFSMLKTGRKWQSKWIDEIDIKPDEKVFAAFLNQKCPVCRNWVPLVLELAKSDDFHKIFIFMPESARMEKTIFENHHRGTLEILTLDDDRFYRLSAQTPLGVLIHSGVIEKKWIKQFPKEYIEEMFEKT
ncbi:MAG: hypothetical protein OEY59_10235, partial [Deltaproteobacteria bacterium]|nr:hypothetical protein [Deltaproteobacteria bacterium]